MAARKRTAPAPEPDEAAAPAPAETESAAPAESATAPAEPVHTVRIRDAGEQPRAGGHVLTERGWVRE